MINKAEAIRKLMDIPGVGKSIAEDLFLLGYNSPSELVEQSPELMYQSLCEKTKVHQDKCLLYVFRCAVYYAKEPNPTPELLKWWNWKDRK